MALPRISTNATFVRSFLATIDRNSNGNGFDRNPSGHMIGFRIFNKE
jgi:hypothetical protein